MASDDETASTSEITALDDAENRILDPDIRQSIKAGDLDDFYNWCDDEGQHMSEDQKTSLVRFTLRWKARMNKYNSDAMTWGWERWRNIVLYEQNEERNEWMKRLRGIADRCLEKAPKDRTEGDVRKIREYLKSVATKNSKVLKLSPDELDTLATTVHVVDYKKGDILFLQGQSGDFYYVVISGTLDLFVETNHAHVAENLEDHASRNFESRVPDDFNMSDFGTRRVTFYPVRLVYARRVLPTFCSLSVPRRFAFFCLSRVSDLANWPLNWTRMATLLLGVDQPRYFSKNAAVCSWLRGKPTPEPS